MLPITNSETMMHFYRNNNALEIVTIKFIQSNFKQLFDIKVSYTLGMCYMKFIEKKEGSFNKFHTKRPEILHEHS